MNKDTFPNGIPDGFRVMYCYHCGKSWVSMCFYINHFLECPYCHNMVSVEKQKTFQNK